MASNDDAGAAGSPASPVFIPGLELSSALYTEVVAPILAEVYPNLRHSAALIGYGSEVLGYDTARSTDHEWGPRLLLFVAEDDLALRERIVTVVDWLTLPQQKLLEVTAGRVYHDGLGEIMPRRDAMAWYPRDVWRYLLA